MTDNQIYEELDNLAELLTERIVDLAGVKGAQQARHAYIYYRSLLNKVLDGIRDRGNKQSNTKAK